MNDMRTGKNPLKVVFLNVQNFGVQGFSDRIGVNSAHVSNVTQFTRPPSPTLIRALREQGLIPPPKKRVRIHAEVYDSYRKRILEEGVKNLGFETWGDFVNEIGKRWEGMDERGELEHVDQVSGWFPWRINPKKVGGVR